MIVVKLDMSNEHGKVIVHVLNIKYLLQRNWILQRKDSNSPRGSSSPLDARQSSLRKEGLNFKFSDWNYKYLFLVLGHSPIAS